MLQQNSFRWTHFPGLTLLLEVVEAEEEDGDEAPPLQFMHFLLVSLLVSFGWFWRLRKSPWRSSEQFLQMASASSLGVSLIEGGGDFPAKEELEDGGLFLNLLGSLC